MGGSQVQQQAQATATVHQATSAAIVAQAPTQTPVVITRIIEITSTPALVSPSPNPSPTDTPQLTATSRPTPTLTPAPTATVLPTPFIDTFDQGLGEGWSVEERGLGSVQGEYRGTYGLASHATESDDYLFKTRLKGTTFTLFVRGEQNQNGYLGYKFSCYGEGGYCYWNRGYLTSLTYLTAHTSYKGFLSDEEYHEVTIEVKGNKIDAYIDGKYFLGITDEEFTSGGVEIGVNGSGPLIAFDSVEIQPLP